MEYQPPIELKLKDKKTPLVFHHSEELEDFLETERNYWGAVFESFPQTSRSYFSNFFQEFKSIYSANTFRSLIENVDKREDIKAKLDNLYYSDSVKFNVLYSKFSKSKYCTGLIKKDPIRGFFALFALSFNWNSNNANEYSRNNQYNHYIILSSVELSVYYKESSSYSKSTKHNIEELIDNLQDKINEANDSIKKNIKLRDKTESQIQGQQKIFSEHLEKYEKAYQENVKSLEEKISDLEKSHRESLQLKAPVDYWEKRATNHGIASLLYLAALIIGFVLIFFSGQFFIGYMNENYKASSLEVPVWIYGSVLFVSGLAFWGLKTLMKLILGNLHSRNDAKLKKIMIQTYLSISDYATEKDKNDLFDKHTTELFNAIFRPVSDGIVKDTFSPHPFLEVLNKKQD